MGAGIATLPLIASSSLTVFLCPPFYTSLVHFLLCKNQHTNHGQIGGHKFTRVLLNHLCPDPSSYLSIRVTLLHILEDLGQRCIRKCFLHFEVQLQYKSACFLLLLLFLFIYTRNIFASERSRNRLLGISVP